jgi:hypothetical protein
VHNRRIYSFSYIGKYMLPYSYMMYPYSPEVEPTL